MPLHAASMSMPRRAIRRTLLPAVILMGFVFVLSSRLPPPSILDHPDRSARAQLEKELPIVKPRPTSTLSAERMRTMLLSKDAERIGTSHDLATPLQAALAAYREAHRDFSLAANINNPNYKVLLYTPGVVGWGNRLQGCVPKADDFPKFFLLYLSLATALVTNRSLIVDWTSPVPLASLVALNPDIPLVSSADLKAAHSSPSKIDANAWNHSNGYLRFPDEVLQRTNLIKDWNAQVVSFSAGEDWLSFLLKNPYLKDEIYSVFGTYPDHAWSEKSLQLVAHELLSFLVTGLSEEALQLLSTSNVGPIYSSPASFVSVQIRLGTNNTSFEPFVDLQKDVPKFWTCVDSYLAQHPTSRVFLATDSIEVKKQAESRYSNAIVYFEGPIVHSGDEQKVDENGVQRSNIGLLKVVVDWYLLGESHLLLRSRNSSFGRSAAIRKPTPTLVLPTQFEDGCPLLR